MAKVLYDYSVRSKHCWLTMILHLYMTGRKFLGEQRLTINIKDDARNLVEIGVSYICPKSKMTLIVCQIKVVMVRCNMQYSYALLFIHDIKNLQFT